MGFAGSQSESRDQGVESANTVSISCFNTFNHIHKQSSVQNASVIYASSFTVDHRSSFI